ncbi:MAG: hydroxyacid dehydrogenase [Clostridia bacterium]|nr:hydroxyacid dehydrogenase [Clostridia bacterium]
MKAIFLTNNKGNIDYVYGEKNIARLSALTDLDTKVYCEEDIVACPKKFEDVEYIFSTWGMPGGGELKLTEYFPSLRALFYAAGSIRYFAQEYFDKGVKITSAFAANAIPVAEFTVGQILLADKGFFHSSMLAKAGDYENANKIAGKHAGNYDAKIGIIGVGMIGRKVIELLKPYRLDILVYDAFLSDEGAQALGVEKCSLDRLFSECDIVSNHLANVPATVGILKGEHFAKMKENATFINTGRGAQIVEEEMLSVLRERPDICALLDVTIEEPPKPDSEFFKLPNVVLTPHIAGSMSNEVRRMAELMVNEFERYLNGEKLEYEITPEKLAKMA